MGLTNTAIEELKKIFFEEFGEELSDAQAQEIGMRLLTLFGIIYRPLPKEN